MCDRRIGFKMGVKTYLGCC